MKDNRFANIDLYRMVAALLIMAHHTYLLGNEDYHVHMYWIYVEFFLLVTGYFTARHFLVKDTVTDSQDGWKETIRYMFHKFRRIYFYTFLCVTFMYLIDFCFDRPDGIRDVVSLVENWLCEVLYLGASGICHYHLAPLWYISAMFLVFPLCCILLQSLKTRYCYLYYISWLFPVIYYGKVGVSGNRAWPNDLLRVFAGLSLGAMVYLLSSKLKEMHLPLSIRRLLSLAEYMAAVCTLLLCYAKTEDTVLVLVLFVIMLVFAFSGQGTIQMPGNRITAFLGNDLSLSTYLTHWIVYKTIQYIAPGMKLYLKIGLAYLGTLVLALMLIIIRRWWNRKYFDSEEQESDKSNQRKNCIP